MAEERPISGKTVVAAWLELARQAAAQGRYDAVPALFAQARAAGFVAEHAREWQLILLEAGAIEEAAQLGPLPAAAAGAVATAPLASEAGDEEEFLRFEPAPRQKEEPTASVPEALVSAFLQWFAGRADVYARQWYDARNDRTGYVPVREPLTAKVVEQHLLGRITIGQYLLFPDDSVSFAVLDLDPTQAAWEQMRLEDSEAPGGLGLPALREYAQRIWQAANEANIPLFLEDTGGAGLHAWLLFAPRISAKRARALCREILYRAGSQPAQVNVEIFPKQDHLGGKGFGNLVKLPLGLHQATVRRSVFLREDLTPIPDQEALARLHAVPAESIATILEKRVLPFRPPAGQEERARESVAERHVESASELGSPRLLAETLANVPAGKEVQRAVDRIVEGCAVVRELLRRAMESETLPAAAARALVYTIGLVGRDNPTIDQALALAGVSRKELERVRRGFQSPVGCKKLHEWFPQFAQRCHCPEPPPGGYATPALFAFPTAPAFPRAESVFVDDPGESAAELLLRHDPGLGGTSDGVERRLERIEQILLRLAELMERQVRASSEPGDES